MREKILIVEDEEEIAMLEQDYLEINGFQTRIESDGEQAVELALTGEFDLILLDLMLPGKNGYDICREIRDKVDVPILMVTARTESIDKVLGLGLGADDYMTKPFNPLEVVARVNANLRRFYQLNPASAEKTTPSVLVLGELELDMKNWILRKNGAEVILTPNEYKLLSFLMQSPGRVYTKSQLCTAINGEYYENYENAVMVYISHLREKIEEDPKAPRYIKNVRGVGYKIEKV